MVDAASGGLTRRNCCCLIPSSTILVSLCRHFSKKSAKSFRNRWERAPRLTKSKKTK